MLIDADHLRIVTERNIHIVRWPTPLDHLSAALRDATSILDFHFAELRGERLSTEHDVLLELSTAFNFPEPSGPAEEGMSWNRASDLLGDLSWLVAEPTKRANGHGVGGLVVGLLNPERLLRSDAIQFAFLVDALACRSRRLLKLWVPFHVVVGPMPEDYRYENFMNVLSASSSFCEACQMIDE